jgi:diketogulonate reductase-like aldo/keto reductase
MAISATITMPTSPIPTLITARGVTMPRLLYGTAWKKERTATLASTALKQGFRGIDTACQPKHYFEPGVGDGIAQTSVPALSREALYLQTKFTPLSGQDPQRVPYDVSAAPAVQVEQSIATSLRNLRTTWLDCVLLHSPIRDQQVFTQVWQALEHQVDAGVVRQIGISNCYDAEVFANLHTQARIKPAVIQNRFYADTNYDPEIRRFCRERGVIYQSFWTLTANPQLLANPVTVTLAGQYGRTPEQTLFRWLTQLDIVPLTGTSSVEHMQQDLSIFEFELSAEELRLLNALLG